MLITLSIILVIFFLLIFVFKKKKKKKSSIKKSDETNKNTESNSNKFKVFQTIVIIFIVFILIILSIFALNELTGIFIMSLFWFWIVIIAVIILSATKLLQGEANVEEVIIKISKTIVWVGLFIIIATSAWKVFSDKPLNINIIAKGVKARMNKPPEEKKQKSWKTVFQKEYTGIGFTSGKDKDGCIYTAMNGRDYFYGDKIIIEGVNAQVWYDGGWQNTEDGKFQYINKSNKSKSQTAVRTKKGEIIIITIKRFM